MPIYEYECADCGHRMETIQKFSEAPLSECPECKHAALKRLISAAGFQLKGSGWYATDFKNSGQKSNKKDTAQDKTSDQKKETSGGSTEGGGSAPEKKAHACGGGGCGSH